MILLGPAIWIGMTLLAMLLLIPQLIALVVLFFATPFRDSSYAGWMERRAIWRIVAIQIPTPIATLLMPLFIAAWRWLPAPLAHWLNTPDDPDPATQGWNGANKEPQVIWVRQHCGAFWCRVYWLQRNCLYGWAVALRGPRVDFDTVEYRLVGSLLVAMWDGDINGAVLRIWPRMIGSKFVVIYFGWKLWSYLDTIVPITKNLNPERDPAKDTGGVPVLTLRITSTNPLAPHVNGVTKPA